MKHPEDLLDHLVRAHDIKPWSLMGSAQANRDHHLALHVRPRKPVDHEHSEEYPDSHPCEWDGCEYTVPFDDEPYCYKHSPDDSSTGGYSYKARGRDREQR